VKLTATYSLYPSESFPFSSSWMLMCTYFSCPKCIWYLPTAATPVTWWLFAQERCRPTAGRHWSASLKNILNEKMDGIEYNLEVNVQYILVLYSFFVLRFILTRLSFHRFGIHSSVENTYFFLYWYYSNQKAPQLRTYTSFLIYK
jgi:hypothetical protein